MENTEENKENPRCKEGQTVDEKLMKPFSLGWTREVVRRVITKNGQPNCDIYYFTPSGKKIRSLTEIKSNLTDGLSAECFSFKRELLGLDSNFETVRDAKHRKKENTSANKEKSGRGVKRAVKPEKPEEKESDVEPKKRKTEVEEEQSKPDTEQEDKEKLTEVGKSRREKVQVQKNSFTKDTPEKAPKKRKSFITKKKTKTKSLAKLPLAKKRKEILKRMISSRQSKQGKILASKKILKKVVKKADSTNKKTNKKETGLNSKKNKVMSKRSQKPVKSTNTKSKSEVNNETESNGNAKNSGSQDLKSIVQKNIGKYREMREKQKLGVVKAPVKKPTKAKLKVVNNSRSESFLKNRNNYLKPLEKGWRRELVYRTNCAKAGHQADVYYFHPSGKKFRSSREISDNLKMISGLSLEFFTFRKEAIGCGEPQEIIRNARSHQKN